MQSAILAIDQGTSSTRAIVYDDQMQPLASAQQEFTQYFPQPGWVEHDPEEIWQTVIHTCRQVLEQTASQISIAAIGITNQRETTLIWDKRTGKAIHPALVWQDRRTHDVCLALKQQGHENYIQATSGLLLDPYFSASKAQWLLDKTEGARNLAKQGHLAFGTIDTYLVWRLTGGTSHVTDATNASRTSLYNIAQGDWDDKLCELFNVPKTLLPKVKDCAANFGTTKADILGQAIPILGIAGDQQAAAIGQACFHPGMIKSTYGTGCFALLNTGTTQVKSNNRLLSTIAYQLNGQTTYALEGSIFIAGAVVQWLRDGLQIIDHAHQAGTLAEASDAQQRLIMVPAFTGLGAPYWNPDCRGAIYGIHRNSGPAEIARAALESIAYQTQDLLTAMLADYPALGNHTKLRVDGGMVASNWTMQFLADILCIDIQVPHNIESTAQGAAWLAGYQAGVYGDMETFGDTWRQDKLFRPSMPADQAQQLYKQWQQAIASTQAMSYSE